MKATLKIINIALFLLAVLAFGFMCLMLFNVRSFYPEDYAARAEAIRAETQVITADTERLNQERLAREEAMKADLSGIGTEGASLQEQIDALRTAQAEKTERLEQLEAETELASHIYEQMLDLRKEYALTIRQLEDKVNAGETDVRICYWTCDDGPSYQTQGFLDAAKEMGAYLTFFTSREANDSAYEDDPAVERELLRQAAMGGHSIQNHTNSHQYSMVAGNLYTKGIDSFREQVQLQDEWVTECTGIKPDIFRFPGGSAHAFRGLPQAELEAVLDELGYVWVDWSCDIFDNAKADQTVAQETANAVYEIKTLPIAMILTHDWNINTLAAFKQAVPQLQNMGYIFLPLFSDSWTIGNTEIIFV